MENPSFETLPGDIQTNILSHLPLKSLMICMGISKKCAALKSIIHSKVFRQTYLSRSMTRPRLLFVAADHFLSRTIFHSVYQKEEPLLSCGQQQMHTVEVPRPYFGVSQPIRGLICHQEEGNNKIVICNPGLKKFSTLPEIQAPKGASMTMMRSYFGYDKVTDAFKVLCMTRFEDVERSKVTQEYKVFTLPSEPNEESWRPITCAHDHDHLPNTIEGIFIGNAIYYGAHDSKSHKFQVMRFDVMSEIFSVIEVPVDVQIDNNYGSKLVKYKLVNYKGEIAFVRQVFSEEFDYGNVHGNGRIDILWVRNESAKNWWPNSIEMPQWHVTVGDNKSYYFRGTLETGELVFAPHTVWPGEPLFVLYYDTDRGDLRRYEVNKGKFDEFHFIRTFVDHVDSTWLI